MIKTPGHILISMLPRRVWTGEKWIGVIGQNFDGSGAVMGEDGITYDALKNFLSCDTGILAQDGQHIFEGDICERMCLDKRCGMSHRGYVAFNTDMGEYALVSPAGAYSLMCRMPSGQHLGITKLGSLAESGHLIDLTPAIT